MKEAFSVVMVVFQERADRPAHKRTHTQSHWAKAMNLEVNIDPDITSLATLTDASRRHTHSVTAAHS